MIEPGSDGGALKQFLAQLMGFGIMALIIWKFAWKHIANIFRSRQQQIRDRVEEADRLTEEAKEEIQKLSSQIVQIDQVSQKCMKEAEKEGRHGTEGLIAEARAAAEQIRTRVRREATVEREKAVLELREDSIRLTLAAAEGLVDRTMDDAAHSALVDRYIENLEKAAKE